MSNLPSLARPRSEVSVDVLVGAFESETQAVIMRTSPRSEHTILYVLVGMVLLSFALISVTKLDRVVTGPGRIEPIAGTLYVQPLQAAIVREIKVRIGDIVKKGQILAMLDPTFAAADAMQQQQKLASTSAMVNRLEAELNGTVYTPNPGDAAGALQRSIWEQDQSQYKAGIADFDARIRQQQSEIEQLRHDADNYRQRVEITSQVEQSFQKLEQEGWGSRLKTLDATSARVEAERLFAQSRNQIPGVQNMHDALVAQRNVYTQQWRSKLSNDLATARDTLHDTQEGLKKAQRLQDLSVLEAPMDAIVLKIGKASAGSVAQSGEQNVDPLFTLVPLDAPLDVELHVDANNIGFIQVGQQVAVKLDAYRFLQHGTAKGVIKTISEGTFTSDDASSLSTPPYFKVFVTLTDVTLRDVPSDFRLIPGMTVTGDVMVGKRTILSYLVEGGLRTGSEAMREP